MKLTSPEIYLNIDDVHTLVRWPPQSAGSETGWFYWPILSWRLYFHQHSMVDIATSCLLLPIVCCVIICVCVMCCVCFFYARKLHIKMRDYLASVMCACILLVHSFMLDKSYLSLCNLICFIQTAKAARKRTCHRHLGGWAVQNTASNPGVPDWERALQNTNTHTHTHPRTTIDVITSVTSHKYA